jgi:hypothetical protein
MPKPFQTEFTFENRKTESARIREKFPALIPVICERVENNTTLVKVVLARQWGTIQSDGGLVGLVRNRNS